MNRPINQTLVVGASGRVGRLLARAWALAGQEPCLQHRGQGLDWTGPQLAWDPLSGDPLSQSFGAMIILAGATKGDFDLNAALATACLKAAQAAAIPRVLLASSSAVYGADADTPYAEDAPLLPRTAYGAAKCAAETVAAAFRAQGMQVTALRIGNVAGADALLTNPARPLLIARFASGLGPLRSYIGPQDMARVLAKLVSLPLPATLNLAAAPVRMEHLATAANLPWCYTAAPSTACESITLNCDRLAALLPLSAPSAAQIVADWQACR